MTETIETQEIRNVAKDILLAETASLYSQGYRLVQLLALNSENGVEITYSFGNKFHLLGLRCVVGKNETMPSVTSVWKGAFLYENEIKDLYGVRIENISIDYQGKFYNVAKEHPFAGTPPKPAPAKPAAPAQAAAAAATPAAKPAATDAKEGDAK
jgi:ech hydrogenase subunit D